jgi:hypothetical protein
MSEHLLSVRGKSPAEVSRLLREKGLRVLHRFGSNLVVETASPAGLDSPEVKHVAEAVAAQPLPAAPAVASDGDPPELAFRLRQTGQYRRSRKSRATQDEDWGRVLGNL